MKVPGVPDCTTVIEMVETLLPHMATDLGRIADAVERIADALEPPKYDHVDRKVGMLQP